MLGESREVSRAVERNRTVSGKGPTLYRGIPVVTSSYLTETVTTVRTSFSLVERFFLWVECLCERAEVYYY